MPEWENLFRHGLRRATFPKGEGFGGRKDNLQNMFNCLRICL